MRGFKKIFKKKKEEAREAPSPEPQVSREAEILKEAEVEKEKPLEKELRKEELPKKIIPPKVAKTKQAVPLVLEKSDTRRQIEKILSEDLEEIYLSLPDNKKEEFKRKGEETASKIEQLVQAVKVQAKKILDLIRNWLRMIPGVNRFFLEQESKIKTDKILALREKDK